MLSGIIYVKDRLYVQVSARCRRFAESIAAAPYIHHSASPSKLEAVSITKKSALIAC
jgi:hypothetical protein